MAGIAGVTGVSELWLQGYGNAKYAAVPRSVTVNAKKGALNDSISPMTLHLAMAVSAYRVISRDRAVQSEIDMQVGLGRATAIDFSQTNERITYVLLAEPSHLVYTVRFW